MGQRKHLSRPDALTVEIFLFSMFGWSGCDSGGKLLCFYVLAGCGSQSGTKKQCYKDMGFKRSLNVVSGTSTDFSPCRLGYSKPATICLLTGGMLIVALSTHAVFVYYTAGEKVLLYFSQDSPGDYVPLEDISKALDISQCTGREETTCKRN
uniref:Uncharacterized protein n=1 Tax=Oncorhynchus tshawytscha TaxID=74940 RepID=A0A8C8LYZ5_ONCTS